MIIFALVLKGISTQTIAFYVKQCNIAERKA